MKTYTGKTLSAILEKIAQEQDVDQSQIVYELVSESGFAIFKTVEIKAFTYKDCMASIKQYIVDVLEAMEIKTEVDVEYNENDYSVNISTDNNGLVIGVNGKNLYALETLVKQVMSNTYHTRFYINLDVNNYFKDKEEKLKRFAYKIAAEVGKTKIDAKLDPMPNYDRKIIHKVLKNLHYVKTKSYGEGKNRYLIVHYDQENDLKHKKEKTESK